MKESRYFKLLNDHAIDFKPYVMEPMYDEYPHLGSFMSTYGVPSPARGDYLICNDAEIDCVSAENDFSNVCFSWEIDIDSLLSKGIIVEVQEDIFKKDMHLLREMSDQRREIYELEWHLQEMNNNREYFSEQQLKEREIELENTRNLIKLKGEEHELILAAILS